MKTRLRILVIGAGLAVWPALALADLSNFQPTTSNPYTPRVPVSELGRAASWFDPARLGVTTSVTVGSGFAGGTNALQVTSFSYRFEAPLWFNVNVGNSWGTNSARNGSFFLEGFDVGYRPFQSLQVEIHYRDVRSPLQRSQGLGHNPWGW